MSPTPMIDTVPFFIVKEESDVKVFWFVETESAAACPAGLFCPLEDRKDKQHHTTNKNRMREIKNQDCKEKQISE